MSFTAEYQGDCEDCEYTIQPGETIKAVDYETRLFAHVTCPKPRPVPVCSTCSLLHAGECL